MRTDGGSSGRSMLTGLRLELVFTLRKSGFRKIPSWGFGMACALGLSYDGVK